MAAVTVSRSGDRLVAVKRVGVDGVDDLRREAQLLQRLDHPGVVQFVDFVELSDGSCALHTAFVSSDTWASRPLTKAVERATAIAALAAVLADLHELGITHGNLTAAHVLHGGNDRPVLCSVTRSLDATPDNVRVDLTAFAELMWDHELTAGPLSDELAKLADAVRSGDRSARDVRLAGAGEIESGSPASRHSPPCSSHWRCLGRVSTSWCCRLRRGVRLDHRSSSPHRSRRDLEFQRGSPHP